MIQDTRAESRDPDVPLFKTNSTLSILAEGSFLHIPLTARYCIILRSRHFLICRRTRLVAAKSKRQTICPSEKSRQARSASAFLKQTDSKGVESPKDMLISGSFTDALFLVCDWIV